MADRGIGNQTALVDELLDHSDFLCGQRRLLRPRRFRRQEIVCILVTLLADDVKSGSQSAFHPSHC